MSDEPKWQQEMAMLFCEAMQTAVLAWMDPRMKELDHSESALAMANITQEFVMKALEIVGRQFGTESSS